MAILDIVTYPSNILRTKSLEITDFDKNLEELAENMAETMYNAPGIGLAAPQIGINKRIIVLDIGEDQESGRLAKLHTLINPIITQAEGKIKYEEGCLSIPGIREYVERPSKIKVEAKDIKGLKIELEAEGLLAVCLQHEIDHINGILFIDHLRGLKKQLANKKLSKLYGTSKA